MIRTLTKGILPVAVCCVFSANTFASTAASSPKEASFLDRVSGTIAIDYSRNAYKSSSYKARRSTGISVGLRYSTDADVIFGVNGRTQYSYDMEEGWFEQDIWLSATKGNLFKPYDWLTIGGDIRAAIPVSEYSDKTDLYTSVRGALTFAFDLSHWAQGLRFTYQPRAMKNFHKYKTAGGQNLIEWDLSGYYELAYGYKDWSFIVGAINGHTWTYKGNYNHPSLTHQEYVGYQLTDSLSFGVGHTNSISFFDPTRGPAPVTRLLDFKNSTFYALAVYSF